MITAKVAKVGFPVKEVALENGSTVAQALTASGCTTSGFDMKIGGRTVTSSTTISNGQTLMLVKKIKGGVTA